MTEAVKKRCKHLYNPGKWPYVKRCENDAMAKHIVCKEHLEWEGDYVDD